MGLTVEKAQTDGAIHEGVKNEPQGRPARSVVYVYHCWKRSELGRKRAETDGGVSRPQRAPEQSRAELVKVVEGARAKA